MSTRTVRLALVMLPALSAAAYANPPSDPSGEEQRLMEMSRQWSRAAESGNIDAIVRYWADDAVVMMPDLPTFRGKDAIRDYVAESMKVPGFRISWEPVEARVSASSDLGYLVERTQVTAPGPSGKLVTQQFRAVTIWRKQADGSWRNVVDIATPGAGAMPTR